MDECWVDMHLLSLTIPGVQMFDSGTANDFLADLRRCHPTIPLPNLGARWQRGDARSRGPSPAHAAAPRREPFMVSGAIAGDTWSHTPRVGITRTTVMAN
jgi:hypothetical protein